MAQISLYGFYEYDDKKLFESCIFPEQGDINLLIEVIMEKSGMLYPRQQSLPHLKQNIQNWFHRYYFNFGKLFESMTSEYNPIENYDRHENWTDTPNVNITKSGGHKNQYGIDTTNTITSDVSAYNSGTYQPDSKSTSTQNGNNTDTLTYQNENTLEHGTRTHEGRIHGNIGVTTNQQMIEAEIRLRQYDVYNNIAEMFENYFLCQVY